MNAGAVIGLLLLWKILSLIVNADILLPPPERVVKEFIIFLSSEKFWTTLLYTVIRGILGFILSSALGLIVGILAGLNRKIEYVFHPFLLVIRSTPVMSIILLALIWFKTGMVPVFASFLVAFPIVYGNVLQGMKSVDSHLLEMAQVFGVSGKEVVRCIRIPSLYSYFYAGLLTAMGITWKVIITAEVLSQPLFAVGTGLQEAKNYLETGKMFAWTLVAILLSAASEGLLKAGNRFVPWGRYHGN